MGYLTTNRRQKAGSKLILSLVFAIGCGTWSGNPVDMTGGGDGSGGGSAQGGTKGVISLSVVAFDVSQRVDVIGKSGTLIGQFAFSRANVVLGNILLARIVQTNSSYHLKGPYVVSLIDGTANPEFAKVGVDPGFYQYVQADFAASSETITTNPDIAGHTLQVDGAFYALDGTEKPFSLLTVVSDQIFAGSTDATQGIDIKGGSESKVNLGFDLTQLFNFHNAATDLLDITDTTITIKDETGNTKAAIAQTLVDNFKKSARFGSEVVLESGATLPVEVPPGSEQGGTSTIDPPAKDTGDGDKEEEEKDNSGPGNAGD